MGLCVASSLEFCTHFLVKGADMGPEGVCLCKWIEEEEKDFVVEINSSVKSKKKRGRISEQRESAIGLEFSREEPPCHL